MRYTPVASYQIASTFEISNRGIVLAGFITNGRIKIGDYIELPVLGKCIKKRISGLEGITYSKPQKVNTGILLKEVTTIEVKYFKKWDPNDYIATILRST